MRDEVIPQDIDMERLKGVYTVNAWTMLNQSVRYVENVFDIAHRNKKHGNDIPQTRENVLKALKISPEDPRLESMRTLIDMCIVATYGGFSAEDMRPAIIGRLMYIIPLERKAEILAGKK